MNAKKAVAIVGAGPGLGAALAETFARAGHPVAIGARTLSKLETLAASINETTQGTGSPQVKAFSVDATDTRSVRDFVKKASGAWSADTHLHVGVWNPNTGFGIRPFQEWTEAQVDEALQVQVLGAHAFTQQFLETLGEPTSDISAPSHRATLLYTGATAAHKGAAKFAGFAAAKAGLRMLVESLAREKGKQGVHACHIVVDGLIDTEHVAKAMGPASHPNQRINVNDLAAQFYYIHQQPMSVWSSELAVRPFSEQW